MYCNNCGCNIPADSHFCPYCGKRQNPAVIYVDEKRNSAFDRGKELFAKGEKALSSVTRNIASKSVAAQENLAQKQSEKAARKAVPENETQSQNDTLRCTVASLLLILNAFVPWVTASIYYYDESVSLFKLLQLLMDIFGSWFFEAASYYSDSAEVWLTQLLLLVISFVFIAMLVLNAINILYQVTRNKSRKSFNRLAMNYSMGVGIVFIACIVFIQVRTGSQGYYGYELSDEININYGPIIAILIPILSGIISKLSGNNRAGVNQKTISK